MTTGLAMHSAKLFYFGGFDMEWSYYTAKARKAVACPTCGVRCKDWQRPHKPRAKKLHYGLNETYDDKVILSQSAKDFFQNDWPGQMSMHQIFDNAWESEPNRVLIVSNPDDVTLYSSEYGSGDNRACTECGLHYCQTFKDYRFRFANPEIIEEDGVFCTDISFGHAFRSPLWLAGPKAAFSISARFREVYLRPLETVDDGMWHLRMEAAFRADPEPDAVEPTYPDFLE